MGNTPPSSIFGEVAIDEASSEYEDISSSFSPHHTPKARVSFLKDKAASLLLGATVQTFLLSPDSKEGEEEYGIVRDGTPEGVSVSRSENFLPLLKSGFQLVGYKGVYDQATNDVSDRVDFWGDSVEVPDPSHTPKASFPSLFGTTIQPYLQVNMRSDHCYIGENDKIEDSSWFKHDLVIKDW